MNYIQVKNWEEFQHYKDRTPPWIKLYNHLLDDFEFSCLPDASKAHLLSIWLLASRTNNNIPANPKWIGNKISATDDVDIDLLVSSGFLEIKTSKNNKLHNAEQDASNPLQEVEQDACTEREGETEREQSREEYIAPKVALCPHQDIIDLYHKILPANPKVRIWNDTRQTSLRTRWNEDSERQDLEWWDKFFGYISQSKFLTGQIDQNGRKPFLADLEWIIKPANFVKIIEGKYE